MANSDGLYSAPGLDTGRYRVRSELAGFKTVQSEAQVQPALGPLASDGLRLVFARADGATTANPAEVAFIRFTLKGLTDGAIGSTGSRLAVLGDSITGSVELRNAE